MDQPSMIGDAPQGVVSGMHGMSGVKPPETKPVFDFSKERAKYDHIISQFTQEVNNCELRRGWRQNKVNVEAERAAGRILADETKIPDRTIELNIRRGATQYIQYVTKANRFLLLTDNKDPGRTLEPLELWFARGMRYPKWKFPWFKLIDAVQLHGGAAVEVVYDPSKPFNCSIEFIPRERLLMPLKTKDIQANPAILRSYELTTTQLDEFTEIYGFDKDVVKKIKEKFTDQTIFCLIYRVLTKKDGLVYNLWYSQDSPDKPLRDYRLHDIGLYDFNPEAIQQAALSPDWMMKRMKPMMGGAGQGMGGMGGMMGEMPMMQGGGMNSGMPMPTTQQDPMAVSTELVAPPKKLKDYPLFWFQYSVTEVEEILEEQGRASLDLHVQEALTHLLTNTVNASTRASGIYGTAEDQPGSDSGLIELGTIRSGTVMNRNVKFWQPPWPNALILSIIQALDVRKANESGNTDFAAMARKDANKTATEMDLSASQAAEQAGVKIETFSSPFLDVYALCFLIAQHQAIFMLCQQPEDPSMLFGNFNMQAAGDVEVIKRLEDRMNAKEFFNIIRGTPAADKLLFFLLDHFFPDQADEWKEALNGGNKDQMILTLLEIVKSIPLDELSPEQQRQLNDVVNTAQGMVAASGNGEVPGASGNAAAGIAPQGNANG